MEEATVSLTNRITEALENSNEALKHCSINRWNLGPDDKNLLRTKYRAKKTWQTSRTQEDKSRCYTLKKKVEAMIQTRKEEKWGMAIGEVDENPTQLWPLLKSLGKWPQPNTPIQEEERWLYSDSEKRNRWQGSCNNNSNLPKQIQIRYKLK